MTPEDRSRLILVLNEYARTIDERLTVVESTTVTWVGVREPEFDTQAVFTLDGLSIPIPDEALDLMGMHARRHLKKKLDDFEQTVLETTNAGLPDAGKYSGPCLRAIFLRELTCGMLRILDEVSEGAWINES